MSELPTTVVLNTSKYKILSPEGFVDFLGVNKISKDSYIYLKFSNGEELKCSEDHPIMTVNGIVKAKDLTKKIEVMTKEAIGCFVISKRHIRKKIDLYDIVNSGTQHLYYTNNIISHNCDFIGSSATLITGSKLRSMAFFNPIESVDGFDIYEQPNQRRMYILTVDCSEGVGQDYSTVNVIDVTEAPYKQVAKYRNNKLPLLFFPTIIYSIARKYNEAFVLIETNNIGKQVVDILHYDLEYENVYKLEHHHIKGQAISSGFKRSTSFGIKTTKSVKKIGCANLKTLIETDKLIVNDFDTIAEMNTFVRVRDSFAAEEGMNDDLVMGLVLFAWLSAQSYFRDSTNIDIRKILLHEQNMLLDEDITPVGYIDDGLKEEVLIDGRDVWTTGKF